MFNLCFVDKVIGKPLPRDSPAPVCPHMFRCTAKDPSIHHLRIPDPLELRISTSFIVARRYCMRCIIFAQSLVSITFTLEVRKDNAGPVSGLALFVVNSVFATILSNCCRCFLPTFSQSSFT